MHAFLVTLMSLLLQMSNILYIHTFTLYIEYEYRKFEIPILGIYIYGA